MGRLVGSLSHSIPSRGGPARTTAWQLFRRRPHLVGSFSGPGHEWAERRYRFDGFRRFSPNTNGRVTQVSIGDPSELIPAFGTAVLPSQTDKPCDQPRDSIFEISLSPTSEAAPATVD